MSVLSQDESAAKNVCAIKLLVVLGFSEITWNQHLELKSRCSGYGSTSGPQLVTMASFTACGVSKVFIFLT